MKQWISVLLCALLVVALASCTSEEPAQPLSLTVAYNSGPTAVSIAKMAADQPALGENVTADYQIIMSPDLMASKLQGQEADIAILPSNQAALLYNKGVPYKLAAVSIWGVLYIASSEDINEWNDLRGREVALIGRGLNPDIILRHLLEYNGLEPDRDVTLTYYSSPQELAQAVIAGKNQIALLPEPMLTTVLSKKPEVKVVLDIQEEWVDTVGGGDSYPQTVVVVKQLLADEHREVVNAFLSEYQKSIEWANDNPAEAGQLVEDMDIGLTAGIVAQAIPRCNLRFVHAQDAKNALIAYFEALMDYSAESVGGALPDDEFYLEK